MKQFDGAGGVSQTRCLQYKCLGHKSTETEVGPELLRLKLELRGGCLSVNRSPSGAEELQVARSVAQW